MAVSKPVFNHLFMKTTKSMLILILVILLVVVGCAIYWWPSKQQWQDAVINLYIKIFCEK
jgi:hypothetical protein